MLLCLPYCDPVGSTIAPYAAREPYLACPNPRGLQQATERCEGKISMLHLRSSMQAHRALVYRLRLRTMPLCTAVRHRPAHQSCLAKLPHQAGHRRQSCRAAAIEDTFVNALQETAALDGLIDTLMRCTSQQQVRCGCHPLRWSSDCTGGAEHVCASAVAARTNRR
jgi:hypothetical protein